MRVLRMLAGAIVVAAVLVPAVQTQDAADVRRLTILTFRAPVQLPGMTLPAGKYRFELADHNAPHIVRVLNEDGTKVIGTFPTIPTTRPTRDLRDTATLVMWAERPAGQPQAAKAWYYPQRSIGEAFVYPKAQALGIALANHTAVPSGDDGKEPFVYPTAQAPAIAAANHTAVPFEDNRQIVEGNEAPNTTAAASRSGPPPPLIREPVPAAVGTSGQSRAANRAPTPVGRLPRTASSLGMFELLSGLSLAAALGVRHLRMRTAARR